MIYPWQISEQQSLWQNHLQQRLHHGLLIHGPAGIGKSAFALHLGHALLCQSPTQNGDPCGQCSACQLLQAGNHPDLFILQPAEDSKVIKIEQIRELINQVSLTSHSGGRRVVVIRPADAMNMSASNSLLKTLEEPPTNTILILVTARPSRLPATIRSRCQAVSMALPPVEQAQAWLENQVAEHDSQALLRLCAGAPLSALQMAEENALETRAGWFTDLLEMTDGSQDPLQTAANWLKSGLNMPLYWMYSWLVDMIRCRFDAAPAQLANQDMHGDLNKLASRVDLDRLYLLLDRVTDAMRVSETSANQQLLLESLLLYWAGLYQR